jgi:hypothetical protein
MGAAEPSANINLVVVLVLSHARGEQVRLRRGVIEEEAQGARAASFCSFIEQSWASEQV